MCDNSPFNAMLYIQLQIVLLYSQEHKVDSAARECIGSLFNKIGTLLSGLVHSCRRAIRGVYAWLVYKILTLQTYKWHWWRSSKICQIMFFQDFFHLSIIVKVRWVTALILQLHPYFTPELVILCEHCYHRHLKSPTHQSQFMTLCLDAPFLSGQISSKYLRSSDGRTLSIGTQYLKGRSWELEP